MEIVIKDGLTKEGASEQISDWREGVSHEGIQRESTPGG